MSENTVVEGEFFNPYPGHVHLLNKSESSPMYQTWMCSQYQHYKNSFIRLGLSQTFCSETGKYTKSFTWNGRERMRYVDDQPSELANLEFYIGGNSYPATHVKGVSFYGGLNDRCGSDDDKVCTKPDGTVVPNGFSEWKYGRKRNGEDGKVKRGKCYCW